MKTLLDNLTKFFRHSQKGQSLTEVAIIAPIAIIMIIGVFEVGWALRGYLVLVNANREATRFAIRPQYLNFTQRDATTVGYDTVLTHTQSTIAQQVNADFDTDAKFIVTHLVVDTGWPCDPENAISTCNCDDFVDPGTSFNVAQEYTLDDKIISPDTSGFEYYAFAHPTSAISDTLINYAAEIADRRHKNNQFNCELLKKGGNPSSNNIIITEIFYDQPQLFGFPFISNPFTDPIPLYTHTTMRLARGSRGAVNNDLETVGPVCDALPFVVYQDTVAWGTEDEINQTVDMLDGNGSTNVGWVTWNPANSASTNTPYLRQQLRSANIPLNDFTNSANGSDNTLTVGDYVSSLEGDQNHTDVEDLVKALVGQKIRVPVWDTFDGTGYHIVGFAWFRIESTTDIDLGASIVNATYLGDATNETCING